MLLGKQAFLLFRSCIVKNRCSDLYHIASALWFVGGFFFTGWSRSYTGLSVSIQGFHGLMTIPQLFAVGEKR